MQTYSPEKVLKSTITVAKACKWLCFEIRSGPTANTDVSCMQSTHAHAHSALAVILSHAATQKHPYLAPQNGHLRGRGCYMRHTERPSGQRPRSLMRSKFKVRRGSALELSPDRVLGGVSAAAWTPTTPPITSTGPWLGALAGRMRWRWHTVLL